MFPAIASTWALLLGVALIMFGNGLQGTLLGVRASVEEFDTTATGLVMTCYFVGFLAGSVVTSRIVRRVGHVRVFAALASVASAAVLVHALYVTPVSWGLVRLLTGFCFAGLYVIAESWLNDRATNETRGALLSVYMLVTLGSMIGGQLLINVGNPVSFELFVLASILVSMAVVPIALTATPAPEFATPTSVSMRQLYRASPLGVVGMVGQGVANGALLSLSAVFAQNAGFSLAETAWFASAPLLGGLLLQWPVGRLSDFLDRRHVLTASALGAGAIALLVNHFAGDSMVALMVGVGLFGGLSLPQYSLCIAHTNDHLQPAQMVAASSTLVLVSGAGLAVGPTAAAIAMDLLGDHGLFLTIGLGELGVGLFALYRMTRRAAVPLEDQGQFVAMSARASPIATQVAVQVMQEQQELEELEEGAA
ncbi:MAG: MFS transporter [Pseudomonadota bacterium]